MDGPIIVERHPGYAVVTLNRPEARNAITLAMRHALSERITALEADPDIRVLILTGAGRGFCAGVDLKELSTLGPRMAPDDLESPVAALARFTGPVIGAINGPAITGGFELALACDVLLAAETARFADTHARVGVLPRWGASQRLSRIIGAARAKELSFTGRFLSAREAAEWGIVNRVVPDVELSSAARALAEAMLAAAPGVLPAYKALIDDGARLTLGEALALESERALAFNAGVKAGDIADRRNAVQEAGRQQAGYQEAVIASRLDAS